MEAIAWIIVGLLFVLVIVALYRADGGTKSSTLGGKPDEPRARDEV